jgi:TRAP-type C4-dicarboxylate transport system permease small subunit
MIKKIIDQFFQNIVGSLMVCLSVALYIIVFMEVCSRYLFNTSLFFPEELARYIIIWIVFLALSVGIREKVHIGLESLTKYLPNKLTKWVILARYAATCFFFIVLAYSSVRFVTIGMKRLTLTMDFPIGYVYIIVPVGSVLALIAVVSETFLFLKEDISK